VSRQRRVIVEVTVPIHRELRKLAMLNDLRIYEITNAMLEAYLKDEERVGALVKKLKANLAVF
jgi:hypothetical protein